MVPIIARVLDSGAVDGCGRAGAAGAAGEVKGAPQLVQVALPPLSRCEQY
ncbi:hypothetical protein [Nocardia cyriacigeorgica]|nr:hypothetical protein [Nocardia cyriacigeorgica]